MSTYMAKAKELDKQWYVIDAAGKPLGRVAAAAATILRGKHKPTYTPHARTAESSLLSSILTRLFSQAISFSRKSGITTQVLSAV